MPSCILVIYMKRGRIEDCESIRDRKIESELTIGSNLKHNIGSNRPNLLLYLVLKKLMNRISRWDEKREELLNSTDLIFQIQILAQCKQNWHKTNRTYTICLVYSSTKQEMNRLIIRKTATSSVSYPLTRSYTNQDVHFKFRTTSQKWPTTWWHSINRTTLVLLLLIWFCVINNLKTEDLLQRLSHSE